MTSASSFIHVISLRARGFALAGLMFLSGFASPLASCAVNNDKGELPPTPAQKLQLGGTLASMNIGPSKLDDGPAQASAPPPPSLQIAILEGEDVSNNIKERTAREPIVQVTDENHKPVAGAVVLFTIESQGGGHAGATFENGARAYQGTTDADGHITAKGFHPNAHTGQFHVNVTATKGNLSTRKSINETNVAAATSSATMATIPGFIATHVALLSLVAGGAVLGSVISVIVVTQPNNGTTITAGTGTVTGPSISRGVAHAPR